MRKATTAVAAAYLALLSAAACTDTATEPANATADDAEGIPALGIGRVEITDNAQETTVLGYSEETNAVVARMTLVHGVFALTGPFREEYATPEVDGRKLDVNVLGQEMTWETGGYSPTLHMSAPPASQNLLATFLDSPQVKPILQHWLIGFDSASAGDESPYGTGSYSGTSVTNCDGLATCGAVHTVNINTCGGTTYLPTYARKANTSASEQKVAQCCPVNAGGVAYPWFATKTCPVSVLGNCDPDGTGPLTTADGTLSACGCVAKTAACKACPAYPSPFDCSVSSNASSVSYSFTDAFKITFGGFTQVNGANMSGAEFVINSSNAYPANIDVRYPTNTAWAYFTHTETINFYAIDNGNMVVSGPCGTTGTRGFFSCSLPPGSYGDFTESVSISP